MGVLNAYQAKQSKAKQSKAKQSKAKQSKAIYDLTFVVPVYNAETFIARCIDSLLNIDTNKEIILIDDGSTDNSLNIIKQYAKQHSEIKIVTQENKGVSASRNLGIKLAQGRYIQFVDADDYIIYTCYQGLVYLCDKYSCDIMRGLAVEKKLDGNIGYQYRPKAFNTVEATSLIINGVQYLNAMVETKGFLTCWLGFYRTEFLRQNQIYFDESISVSEDSLFLIDCFLTQDIQLIYFPHYIYLYQRNAQSSTLKKDNFAGFKDILTACQIMREKQQRHFKTDREKTNIIAYMLESTYRYAYHNFYLNFSPELKIAAKELFQQHNITLPKIEN